LDRLEEEEVIEEVEKAEEAKGAMVQVSTVPAPSILEPLGTSYEQCDNILISNFNS